MNIARLIARAGIAVLVIIVCAAPALAQRPRPDRPYRGLFGGNGADPNSRQQFDLNVSLFGAYDDNVLAGGAQIGLDPRFQQTGNYDGGTVSLDYSRRAGRGTIDFTGGTSYRYYPSLTELNGSNSFISVGLTSKLSPHTDFRTTESASYSPFYSLGAASGPMTVIPGEVAPIISNYPLAQDSTFSLLSSSSIDHRVSPRASFSADYLIQHTRYRATDRIYDSWLGGGQYGYKLSSLASMRLAYHYNRYDYSISGVSQPTSGHNLDFGMDFTRPLSPSRTMTFGFTVGSSVERVVGTSHVLATGSGYLNRQVTRSWSANLGYSRGIQYVAGFPSPFFSNSASAGLSGFLSPRSRVSVSAGYINGQTGIATTNQGYRTYSGVADYQFALNRFIALTVDYNYYHYIFDPTVVLPPGISRGLNRQSIRGGLNLWLPLLR